MYCILKLKRLRNVLLATLVTCGAQSAIMAQQDGIVGTVVVVEEVGTQVPISKIDAPIASIFNEMQTQSKIVSVVSAGPRTDQDPFTRLHAIHATDSIVILLATELRTDAASIGIAEQSWAAVKELVIKRQQARNDDRAELRKLLEQVASNNEVDAFLEQVARTEAFREKELEARLEEVLNGDEIEAFATFLLKRGLNAINTNAVAEFLNYSESQRRHIAAAKAQTRAAMLRKAQHAIDTGTFMTATPDDVFNAQLPIFRHFTPEQFETVLRITKGITNRTELDTYCATLSTDNAAKLRKLLQPE